MAKQIRVDHIFNPKAYEESASQDDRIDTSDYIYELLEKDAGILFEFGQKRARVSFMLSANYPNGENIISCTRHRYSQRPRAFEKFDLIYDLGRKLGVLQDRSLEEDNKMAKLKPIEQLAEDVKKGDLIRIVYSKGQEKAGYLADVYVNGDEVGVTFNCEPKSSGWPNVFDGNLTYSTTNKKENLWIKGYEVLRRAKNN